MHRIKELAIKNVHQSEICVPGITMCWDLSHCHAYEDNFFAGDIDI